GDRGRVPAGDPGVHHLADPRNGVRRPDARPQDPAAACPGCHGHRGADRRTQGTLRSPVAGDFRMLTYVIPLCMVMLGLALALNMLRLIRGPSVPDRVLALDTLYINGLALIVLF